MKIAVTPLNHFERWKIETQATVEWGGLEGVLSWDLFDGRFVCNHKATIVEPRKLVVMFSKE